MIKLLLKKLSNSSNNYSKIGKHLAFLFSILQFNSVAQNFHATTGFNFSQDKSNRNLVDTSFSNKNNQYNYQTSLSLDYINKENTIIRVIGMYGSTFYSKHSSFKRKNVLANYTEYTIKKNNFGAGAGLGKQYIFKNFILKALTSFSYNTFSNDSQISRTYQYGTRPSTRIYTKTKTPNNQINLFFDTSLLYKMSQNFYLGVNINSGLDFTWGNQKQYEYIYYSDKIKTTQTNTTSNLHNNNFTYTNLNYQLFICYSYK
jgi:hypothetical protein